MLAVRSKFGQEIAKRAMATSSASLLSESPKNTVNESEVSKFRQLSDSWWDPNGPLNGLHSMNRLRVPFIRDGLIHTGHAQSGVAKPLEGLSILVGTSLCKIQTASPFAEFPKEIKRIMSGLALLL